MMTDQLEVELLEPEDKIFFDHDGKSKILIVDNIWFTPLIPYPYEHPVDVTVTGCFEGTDETIEFTRTSGTNVTLLEEIDED